MKFWQFEFTIQALNTVEFSSFSGPALRGGFGDILKKLTCHTGLQDCTGCPSFRDCPFTKIFNIAPPIDDAHFKNETQVPRPFIFEAVRERTISHGQKATFRLGLVGAAIEHLPYFVLCFQQLGKIGIGKGRGKFKLMSVLSIDPIGKTLPIRIFDSSENILYLKKSIAVELSELDSTESTLMSTNGIRIVFDSPTHLNRRGEAADQSPSFEQLIRGILRRYSDLAALYGPGRPELDYRQIVEKSKAICLKRSDLTFSRAKSFSHRKNALTPVDGLLGSIEYEGDVTPFLNYLMLGQWLHVGKQATFGMGQYHVECI